MTGNAAEACAFPMYAPIELALLRLDRMCPDRMCPSALEKSGSRVDTESSKVCCSIPYAVSKAHQKEEVFRSHI